MSISATLNTYLTSHTNHFDTIPHSFSERMLQAAYSSQLPAKDVVKAVILKGAGHYLMAIVPAMNKVLLSQVSRIMGHKMELAREDELQTLFDDCATGAIPAVGDAFNMAIVWDDNLATGEQVYIEAGDHRHLVQLDASQYRRWLKNKPHGPISCDPDDLSDLSNY